MHFKEFLLNENKAYFGQRVGDILNAVQDLDENGKSMGTRQLMRNAEAVVNQIRRILHTNWSKSDEKYLKKLQQVGVALARVLDPKVDKGEKDDIYEIIAAAKSQLEQVCDKMGVPISEPEEEDQEPPTESPEPAQPNDQVQPPSQPSLG
jgi:predicted transcriptional regulator